MRDSEAGRSPQEHRIRGYEYLFKMSTYQERLMERIRKVGKAHALAVVRGEAKRTAREEA